LTILSKVTSGTALSGTKGQLHVLGRSLNIQYTLNELHASPYNDRMPSTADREFKRLCKAVQEACRKLPGASSPAAEAALVRVTGAEILGYMQRILKIWALPPELHFAASGVFDGNAFKSWHMMFQAIENGLVSHFLTFLSRSLHVLPAELSRHPEGFVFRAWLGVGHMLCALVSFAEGLTASTDADEAAKGSYSLMQQLQPADDLAGPG
jgi:hypothetical protein